MRQVADGSERPVANLGAGGDDLERRVQDLDLDVHVVHLVLERGLDQEPVALDRVDADLLGAMEDGLDFAHRWKIAAAPG